MATSVRSLADELRPLPGAVYYRVSTDGQDTARQHEAVERWLAANDLQVPRHRTYEDIHWTRDEADERPDFQRLIRDAEAGRVKWIVVDAQDRFGAKNEKQLVAYVYRLEEAGCRLVTVDNEELTGDDLLTFIKLGMGGRKSREEQLDKSKRVLEGKLTRAKRGEWQGGHVPPGMDVVCLDLDDNERWRVQIVGRKTRVVLKEQANGTFKRKRVNDDLRVKVHVDGTRQRYDGAGNFPATELGETLQLRPTADATLIKHIREVFESFATEAINYNQLADRLNTLRVPHTYGRRWEHYHVSAMLANPIYTGRQRYNGTSQGKFFTFRDGSRQPVTKRHARNKKSDHVLSEEQLFDPVVPLDTWERVQAKLEASPAQRRAPKSAGLWLSGLLVCAKCGQKMRGYALPKENGRHEYICATYARKAKGEHCECQRNAIPHATVEQYVKQYLEDTSQHVAELATTRRHDAPQPYMDAIVKALVAWSQMAAVVKQANPGINIATMGETQEEQVEALYRAQYEGDHLQARQQLDQLQAEFREQTLSLARVRSQMQREVIETRLAELEQEIKELRQRTTNAADAYREASAECDRMAREWDEAKAAVNSDMASRRKADAVSRVIGQIVVTFRATGKRHPTSVWDVMEIVPAVGDVTVKYPNRASSTRCTSRRASTSTTTSPA